MAGAQEKQAQDTAVSRMRAFEVGVAHLCKDAGIAYNDLAKAAGATPETLGPTLVEAMIEAGKEQQA